MVRMRRGAQLWSGNHAQIEYWILHTQACGQNDLDIICNTESFKDDLQQEEISYDMKDKVHCLSSRKAGLGNKAEIPGWRLPKILQDTRPARAVYQGLLPRGIGGEVRKMEGEGENGRIDGKNMKILSERTEAEPKKQIK